MRKMHDVLYVTHPDATLSTDDERIIVRVKNKVVKRMPLDTLEAIVCFGSQKFNQRLMVACAKNGIGLSWITEEGEFLCRISGKVTSNVLLRKQQYKLSDHRIKCGNLARSIAAGKLLNARTMLLDFQNEHPTHCDEVYKENLQQLQEVVEKVGQAVDIDVEIIRGLTKIGDKAYFRCLNTRILGDEEAFYFQYRNKRLPLDRVNALLDFIYILLECEVTAALEAVELDPQVGFLHKDKPGSNSLTLDLMEELRPVLADQLALSLINTGVLTANDFKMDTNGAYCLAEESKNVVLTHWKNLKEEKVKHLFLDKEIELGLIAYIQAQLLVRYVKGEMDMYPPFLCKVKEVEKVAKIVH